MKRKLIILVNIDDTIENLCEEWCNYLNEKYSCNVHYQEVTEWDISKFFPGLTREQVFEPLHTPEIWYKLKSKDGAVKYVKQLMDDGHNVYLCTSTDYRNVRPKFEGVIQKYFPYISWNQVIITSNKQMIKADVLIDDGIHNLIGGDYIKVLMSAPHNMAFDADSNGMYRVNTWEETYELVCSLLNQKIHKECSFGKGISIRPDGIHELSPHIYQETQIIHNATVQILKCKKCGNESVAWMRQPNSYEDDNLFMVEE